MLKNNQNESRLWDSKYEKVGNYNSPEDYFKFAEINPTVLAIKPYIKDGINILEVGSGTGELISYLQHTHPTINTYGLDFSAVSISNSKTNSQKFNIPVSFTEGDIKNMPFENDFFDIVYGDQVLAHLDNIDLALKEIYRVTKKGGIVAFTSANKLRPDGWDLYKKLSKTHEGYKQESFYPWQLNRMLNNQGFSKVKYYGEVLFLFRNITLLKNFFVNKKVEQKQDKSEIIKNKSNVETKSLFKKMYKFIDLNSPPILKVTIGILARK